MRILYLSNIFPAHEKDYFTASFINKRLDQLAGKDIDYNVYAFVPHKDSRAISSLKKVLNKDQITYDSGLNFSKITVNGIGYHYVRCERDIIDVLKLRLFKQEAINIAKKQAKAIMNILESKDDRYDILHAHGMYIPPAGIGAAEIAKCHNIPYIITLHGSDINYVMKGREDEYINAMENAARCIFVSNALLRKAKESGYSAKNAVVIPNGYDPLIFFPRNKAQERIKLGIHRPDYKYIGYVGALSSIKRADKFPKIFREIKRGEERVFFLIIGDGPLRKTIETECRDIDLKVTGIVPHNEVGKYMAAMDVIILPSRNEGWPCVVLESHACGTLVIGSDNGGIPEAMGSNEYIVEEGKSFEKRFAKKVIDVLNDKDTETKLAETINRARNYVWKNVVEREVEIYRNALTNRHKS